MRESNLTTLFKHSIEEKLPSSTTVYELKMVKGKRFPLATVKEHQVKGLLDALHGLWYKLADMSAINGFGAKKPFDAVWIKAAEAFVVPIFYVPRVRKTVYLIPIMDFIRLRETNKSLTEDQLSIFANWEI